MTDQESDSSLVSAPDALRIPSGSSLVVHDPQDHAQHPERVRQNAEGDECVSDHGSTLCDEFGNVWRQTLDGPKFVRWRCDDDRA